MMRAAAEEQYCYAATAQAQQLAAAEKIAREQDIMVRRAAVNTKLTADQYTMMMPPAVAGQQRHDQAQQQYAAMPMGSDVMLRHGGHPDLQLIANPQQLLMMVQGPDDHAIPAWAPS